MYEIISFLSALFIKRKKDVDAWFENAFQRTTPLFYNSVDIRHSGFKIAPVDTNIFPGGFNNLTAKERKYSTEVAKHFFQAYFPDVKKVFIIMEDHTRNTYYLENVAVLRDILQDAALDVRMGSFQVAAAGEQVALTTASGQSILSSPLVKKGSYVMAKDGFKPDLLLINNDLTAGTPDLIEGINQPIIPPVGFGWYQRRKSSHFDTYNDIARQFCREFRIDPWLVSTFFHKCGVVDFKQGAGIECVALEVDKIILRIKEKYDEFGIKETPYAFIKSDRGTYGMGIMTARSGEEVLSMNKKIRTKMNAIKGGAINSEVIIQEGVPTVDTVDGQPAEPLIYLIGGKPVGCIYRVNTRRDKYDNLNAAGMQFASISVVHGPEKNECPVFGTIAKLASFSSAWECYNESYMI